MSDLSPHTSASAPSEAADLEQVRELLFGAQVRATHAEVERLRDDLSSRIDTLEGWLREQFQALQATLSQERAARAADRASAQSDLTAHALQAGGELESVEQRVTGSVARTREELARRCDELRADLLRQLGQMQDSKADRDALSSLFGELSQRLLPQTPAPPDPTDEPGDPSGSQDRPS